MVALFDSMHWADEENDLSTAGTAIMGLKAIIPIDELISSQLPGRPNSQLRRCYTLSVGLAGRRGRRVESAVADPSKAKVGLVGTGHVEWPCFILANPS
jgi:hypothetical protein